MAAIDIDIAVEAEGWPPEPDLAALCERAVAAAADHLETYEGQPFPDVAAELSIVFTDDATIRELNGRWREKDKATNVLSFPAFPVTPGMLPGPMLGDLVLARETIEIEAGDLRISLEAHLTHLLVHGFLHLLGYDHLVEAEAEAMEALETRILATLGLSDPYEGTDPA